MLGVIRSRDVIAHAPLIAREFGLRCLFRCAWVCLLSRQKTFLDCVWDHQQRE